MDSKLRPESEIIVSLDLDRNDENSVANLKTGHMRYSEFKNVLENDETESSCDVFDESICEIYPFFSNSETNRQLISDSPAIRYFRFWRGVKWEL